MDIAQAEKIIREGPKYHYDPEVCEAQETVLKAIKLGYTLKIDTDSRLDEVRLHMSNGMIHTIDQIAAYDLKFNEEDPDCVDLHIFCGRLRPKSIKD